MTRRVHGDFVFRSNFAVDFDFVIGKQRLRGNGLRGLVALALMLVFRASIIFAIALAAKPGMSWLSQILTSRINL